MRQAPANAQEPGRPSKRGAHSGRWPLLAQPPGLVGYMVAVVLLELLLIPVLARTTQVNGRDLLVFAALLACGSVCIEATRRLGMPAGISRDLLSAWWLPVALLLPPVYALLAPIPLHIMLQLRVRATLLYRRVFTTAAVGLAGCTASIVFHEAVPDPLGRPAAWLVGDHGLMLLLAVGCAAMFAVVNTALVAVAARGCDPEARWRDVLWDRESLILDVVELCLGVLVAIACALTPALLLLALPPVVLLQRSLLHAQLQAAARTDDKTGLLNAAAWQREAGTEIGRAQRTHESLALLIVDIDHFKRVNDKHGHLVGDQVLVAVASTLRSQLREYDVIGRFGGEEFVVLLPHSDLAEAKRVAERLRVRVARMALPAENAMVSVTISIGVAIMRIHGDDLIELLAAADLALYRAKALGRDRVCLPAGNRLPGHPAGAAPAHSGGAAPAQAPAHSAGAAPAHSGGPPSAHSGAAPPSPHSNGTGPAHPNGTGPAHPAGITPAHPNGTAPVRPAGPAAVHPHGAAPAHPSHGDGPPPPDSPRPVDQGDP
ncbi:sensor domain-containing diguanylate cyclase [Bailinhaonella thermotolerans]|uniref:sensor domain-containing diguanylate cyclase n=1 Tax=Bailinhaonella thermotolerans TaxID=1070861 RepID=UPI002413834E|nr:diguanylate cyclase [Bailinhaonella thermotolerans]